MRDLSLRRLVPSRFPWPLAGLLLGLSLAPGDARSQPSPEQVARLGEELTALGAERAGNADGTIPAWTGGITQVPPGYQPGDFHPDPFAGEEPLFTIDPQNVARYGDRVCDGHKALLQAYPKTWRMPVYPSHRTAAYPDWVAQAVRENATRARLVTEGKGGVEGARVSSPFPIPQRGVEVMWNHNLRWRGVFIRRSQGVAAVTRGGRYGLVLSIQEIAIPYGARVENALGRRYPNALFAVKSRIIQPALLAGNGSLLLETIDQSLSPRKAWSYSQALRRVVRNPNVAYDFPSPLSDGLATVDDADMFIGPPDRFEWKLLGKRELYVPYNAYRLDSGDLDAGDILRVGHIEPNLARYELHRVWVVEGTLKPGKKHVYGRRVYYVDEDSWQILVGELYDRNGRLWRVTEGHAIEFYEVPLLWTTLEVEHDLKERRYYATGLDNSRQAPTFSEEGDPREFSPNALSYYVR